MFASGSPASPSAPPLLQASVEIGVRNENQELAFFFCLPRNLRE